MRILFWFLVLTAAFAFGTLAAGWWAVPVLAALGALVVPRPGRPLVLVPVAAGVAWGLLLLRAGRGSEFATLLERLTGVASAPPAALIAATLAFPLLLAFGAALVVGGLRPAGGAAQRP